MGLLGGKKEFKPKKIKKKSNTLKNVGFYVVIVTLLVVAFLGLQVETSKYKKEVQVVSLKEEVGAKIITEDDLSAMRLPLKAYTEDMILWDERDSEEKGLIDKYASMQIRRETPVYVDMVTDKPLTKYKYLYELAPNEELLTFSYDSSMAAGRIPRPGDRFRIRGSFKLSDEQLAAMKSGLISFNTNSPVKTEDIKDEEGKVEIEGTAQTRTLLGDVLTDRVFDVVTVVDMLNDQQDSIYETVREIEALPKVQQEELTSTDAIKKALTPSSLLLIVKSNQVSNYVEFDSNQDVQYTLTLLTRDKSLMEDDIRSGGSIIDGLNIETAPSTEGVDN